MAYNYIYPTGRIGITRRFHFWQCKSVVFEDTNLHVLIHIYRWRIYNICFILGLSVKLIMEYESNLSFAMSLDTCIDARRWLRHRGIRIWSSFRTSLYLMRMHDVGCLPCRPVTTTYFAAHYGKPSILVTDVDLKLWKKSLCSCRAEGCSSELQDVWIVRYAFGKDFVLISCCLDIWGFHSLKSWTESKRRLNAAT